MIALLLGAALLIAADDPPTDDIPGPEGDACVVIRMSPGASIEHMDIKRDEDGKVWMGGGFLHGFEVKGDQDMITAGPCA